MDRAAFASTLYIELNLFAVSIMLVLLIFIRSKKSRLLLDQKLFITMVISNIFLLVLDSAMVLLDGVPGQYARIFMYISTFLYYIFNTLICLFWYLYVHYFIYRNKVALKKQIFTIGVPFFAVAIMAIISLFADVIYYIDADNIYHRGRYFLVMVLICFLYIAYAYILLIVKRKMINKREFLSLALFIVPAVIGGVIQILVYGITLLWICATLSLLIIYINIQNGQLYKDYLTDLYNRRQFDNYIRAKINSSNKKIAGLMIDIDSFKKINDLYGHDNGDLALKYTAQILRETFSEKDFIARYGGDEFVVVIEVSDEEEPYEYIDKINYGFEKFNSTKELPFKITASVGYGIHVSNETVTDFFRKMDKMMYINKNKSKETA
ncbi:MAG TPA: GGDEF domain-containing protein [Clostridia bacterium]|nr:GGDEF domain-containing protein [Clostridia bacterium]HXK71166.1 GGDEF domain-containing protein [Clostridia bacterium]